MFFIFFVVDMLLFYFVFFFFFFFQAEDGIRDGRVTGVQTCALPISVRMTGSRFLTLDNAFGTLRSNLEVGLLAVALTPVILTGGIDLSVGSLIGICAIVLGKLWRDAHWSISGAAAGTLAVGAAAGLLNGWLITRLRIPPLIVTLGSFSLFR